MYTETSFLSLKTTLDQSNIGFIIFSHELSKSGSRYVYYSRDFDTLEQIVSCNLVYTFQTIVSVWSPLDWTNKSIYNLFSQNNQKLFQLFNEKKLKSGFWTPFSTSTCSTTKVSQHKQTHLPVFFNTTWNETAPSKYTYIASNTWDLVLH